MRDTKEVKKEMDRLLKYSIKVDSLILISTQIAGPQQLI